MKRVMSHAVRGRPVGGGRWDWNRAAAADEAVGREGAEAQLCRLLADTLSALEPHDRLLSWGRVTLGLQVTHGQRDRQEP